MVRILQYDPQVYAEAYSQRQAAERPFESPVAAGLGQLGRALMAREERREPGHQDQTQAMAALTRMRKKEFARLKDHGVYRSQDPRWSAKGFLEEHLKRRDEEIAALARVNPRAARIVAKNSATLTEDLSRRAIVTESGHAGDALVSDINAAVGDAIETVRTDPTQLGAVLSEFRATLTGLAENGVDPDATATIVGAAERKITRAAISQRLEEAPEVVREELAAGDFGDALPSEQVEALLARADHEVKVRQRRTEAAAKSSEEGFEQEFRAYEQRLFNGDAPDDEKFSDEAIRAGVSPDVAEWLILERGRAEARGRAFAEIEFMSEAEIEERLGEAERDEVRHLLWARGHRRRLMKQGPAAFALRDPIVREAHERWLQARADGDAAAAGVAGLAYANATLAAQRRMGLSAQDQSVFTTEMAAELVRETELPEGADAAVLGTMLRDQLGGHWRVALADLERAGLSEQVAIIAALDGPGQQPAARQLAELVGTRTSDLRGSAGDAAAAIDHLLGITINGTQRAPGDSAVGADSNRAELVRRRAYALAAEGLAPNMAVQRAIEDLSVANTSVTTGMEGLSIEVLAESQGIRPSALGSGGPRVESILRRFTRFFELSDDELDSLKEDIGRLNGEHEGYRALRDRFIDLENSVRFFGSASDREVIDQHPISVLELNYMQLVARNEENDPISRSIVFSGIGSALLDSERIGEENRAWIDDALTGDHVGRRDFAADYLAHVGRLTGFNIGEVLSESGREIYLALAQTRYEARNHPESGPRRSSDARLEALAEFATSDGRWGVPMRLAARLLVDISRSVDSNDEQREALIEYISRVVTPFNRVVGQRLQHAVSVLRAGSENVGEFPGRFAFLLSDDQLVEAAVARGMDKLNFNSKPLRPEGLDWIDHTIGVSGVALGVGGTLASGGLVSLSAALLGLTGSTVGYGRAIDDANDELNAYLINMELYHRFQGTLTHPGTSAVENSIRDPDDTPGGNQSRGDVRVEDPARDLLAPR